MASSRSVLRKRVLYRSLSDHFLINKEAILSRETKAALLYMPNLALKFFTTRSRMVRDWAKSSGGGGLGWARAFGNVVVKKHMTHPPALRHKND